MHYRPVIGAISAVLCGSCASAADLAPSAEGLSSEPHTVVWRTPSKDSSGSMPLGNGDIGVNVWDEEGGDLLFYIGKTDAWSETGRLLKLGRVRVALTPNPFQRGQPFHQALDVREGVVHIEVGPASAPVKLRVWVDARYPAVRVEVDSARPLDVRVSLETWRNEPRQLLPEELHSAYGLIHSPSPIVVDPDTVMEGQKDRIVWYHRNERSIWRDTLQIQGMEGWTEEEADPLQGRTFGGLVRGEGLVSDGPRALTSATARSHQAFAAYVLTAIEDGSQRWLRQVEALAADDADDWAPAWAAHAATWRAFWDRSWIRVAGPDEETRAVTSGYVLQRFVTASAGRGGSPVKFNGSIFTVDAEVSGERLDADYRRWGGPYWFQNTRLIYWPMLAAGDFDLMQPLFRMYLDALPFARARTQVYFGHGGAFFPEVMYPWGAYATDNYGWDRRGKAVSDVENRSIRWYYSGALELLSMMLDHHAYTDHPDFLAQQLLPFADAILAFYGEHYPHDASGKLRLEPAQSLETWRSVIDPMPDIGGLHHALGRLLALPREEVGDARLASWRHLLASVPEVPTAEAPGGRVLAPAARLLDQRRSSKETPELYAVFPYRLHGVGRPDLDMARRTFAARAFKGSWGWHQDEIQAAHLGLAADARAGLVERMAADTAGSRFPAFWGPNYDWTPDQDHGSSGMMALQAMLLQADGRKILLFPAWPRAWDVEFKLRAPHDTTVEGVYRGGRLESLVVTPAEREADLVRLDPQ